MKQFLCIVHYKKSKTYTQLAFCAPVVTQFIVKLANKEKSKTTKEKQFLKFNISLLVRISNCKGVSRASSDRILYLNIKIDTKSLICQVMIVNKDQHIPSFFFLIICLKFSPVYKPLLIMSLHASPFSTKIKLSSSR